MDYIMVGLLVSLVVNLLLCYYSIVAAKRLYLVGTNLEALENMLEEYKVHLEGVHEMEMFYGDATLGSLMSHSKDILQELEAYRDIIDVVVEEQDLAEEETEEE